MKKFGIAKDRENPVEDFNKTYYGTDSRSPSKTWYVLMIIWIIFLWFLFGNTVLRGELNFFQAAFSGIGILMITWFFGPFNK